MYRFKIFMQDANSLRITRYPIFLVRGGTPTCFVEFLQLLFSCVVCDAHFDMVHLLCFYTSFQLTKWPGFSSVSPKRFGGLPKSEFSEHLATQTLNSVYVFNMKKQCVYG